MINVVNLSLHRVLRFETFKNVNVFFIVNNFSINVTNY